MYSYPNFIQRFP